MVFIGLCTDGSTDVGVPFAWPRLAVPNDMPGQISAVYNCTEGSRVHPYRRARVTDQYNNNQRSLLSLLPHRPHMRELTDLSIRMLIAGLYNLGKKTLLVVIVPLVLVQVEAQSKRWWRTCGFSAGASSDHNIQLCVAKCDQLADRDDPSA